MIEISQCKPGVKVWYSPSVYEGAPRYAAIVADEPRMLGQTPIVYLKDLPAAYAATKLHPRTTVPAAALFALELREDVAEGPAPQSEAGDMTDAPAFEAWAIARLEWLAVRRERLSFRCEYEERSDQEVGDPGVAACWRNGDDMNAERCDACQEREPVFQLERRLRRAERVAFRRLVRAADRFSKQEAVRGKEEKAEGRDVCAAPNVRPNVIGRRVGLGRSPRRRRDARSGF